MAVYLCGGTTKITMRKRLTEEIRAERSASPTDRIPVVALLENLRSAHNVGSFFRTADAFGLAELWLSGYSCRPPHIQLDKVALGATETVPWQGFADAAEAVAAARAAGMAVYAVEQTDASVSLSAMPTPPAGIVLVFGNEVDGVEPATLALCDGALEVPQFGLKHSLNVSVCGGAVLWEACRRYRGL
jgi:tRNA G18 (ribose-2'-O)-methylase SpoU